MNTEPIIKPVNYLMALFCGFGLFLLFVMGPNFLRECIPDELKSKPIVTEPIQSNIKTNWLNDDFGMWMLIIPLLSQ